MGCKASKCNKTTTLECISIVTSSLEVWPTKAEEALPNVGRLIPLDTNPVFSLQNLPQHSALAEAFTEGNLCFL